MLRYAGRVGAVLWVLGVVCAGALHGQRGYLELAAAHGRVQIYHEAAVLPAGDRAAIVVSFRIPNPALVFTVDHQAPQGFSARPELIVELYRKGEYLDERAWRGAHRVPSFEATQDPAQDVTGMVRFDVSPGAYGYRVLFKDNHVGKTIGSPLRRLTVPGPRDPGVRQAVLVRSVRQEGEDVVAAPVNLGGDAPFGEAFYGVVPVVLPAESPLREDEGSLRYRLRRVQGSVSRGRARRRQWTQVEPGESPRRLDLEQEPPPAPGPVVQEGRVAGTAFLPVGAVRPAPQDGSLHWPSSLETRTYLVPIDLGGATLEDGTYLLEAELEASHASAVSRTLFATHWRNMPLSLYDAEVAIENLIFIEDRKTVKAMLRGRNDDKAHRIASYWQARDPTPGTVFNELMAEYYGRIDDAAVRFRTDTVPGPDGLDTDQARIFIRNGPADAAERVVLSSGGVQETWTYADGRRFVFWAASSLDAFELQEQ